MADKIDSLPGVILRDGKPVPTLVITAQNDQWYSHHCIGHRLEGDSVHQLLKACQDAIAAAARLE